MNVSDIINKALIEYDSAQPVIRYLLKNTDYQGHKTNNDFERTTFKFVDKETEQVVLETEAEILGIYYDKLNIWSWAWSQTGLRNSEIYLAKEILLYALKLEYGSSYIKSVLTTSRGIIKDITQIDINLAIGSSIIKQPYIYPYYYRVEDNYLIYYLILLNKPELDKLNQKLKQKTESEYNSE